MNNIYKYHFQNKNIYDINKTFPSNNKYINNIRKSIINLIDDYIERHNKAFIVRFTVTFPKIYELDNTYPYISRFIAKIVQYFKRKKYDPNYLWVREQNTSEHPHYHFIFIVNGNKMQHPKNITEKALEFWSLTLNTDATGRIHYDYSQMLRRSDVDFYRQRLNAFNNLKYLAKVFTKGKINDGVRNFGMTRL